MDRFARNVQIPNLMKIRPVEAELFRENGKTWRSYELLYAILRPRIIKRVFLLLPYLF